MKEPWISLILSIAGPGFGHYYIGKKRLGIVLFLTIICLILYGIKEISEPYGNTGIGLETLFLGMIAWLIVVIDSFLRAKRDNNLQFEKERRSGKNPYIAATFSYLIPGLGQLYGNNVLIGGIFFLLYLCIMFFLKELNNHYPISLLIRGIAALHAAAWMKGGRQASIKEAGTIISIFCLSIFLRPLIPDVLNIKSSIIRIVYQPSMFPGLHSNDIVLIDTSHIGTNKRWDILGFREEEDNRIRYTRILGFGGETIEIKKGDIYINNKEIECELYKETQYSKKSKYLYNLQDTSYQVHIDSLIVFEDSTAILHNKFKTSSIGSDEVVGSVYKIIWPPSRISLFENN